MFTKLDLAQAYQQVSLSACSKQLTINTSRGLFQYHCLPFMVAAAPSIFQRTMETLLHGILLNVLSSSPVTVNKITILDPLFSRVCEYVSSGWHTAEDEYDIHPSLHRKDSLSVKDGCILWGHHVVIPPVDNEVVPDQLHS